jgi:hypothetical protein
MGRDFSYVSGQIEDPDAEDSWGRTHWQYLNFSVSRHNDYIGHLEGYYFSKKEMVAKIKELAHQLSNVGEVGDSHSEDEDHTPIDDIGDIAEAIKVFASLIQETGDRGATIRYC